MTSESPARPRDVFAGALRDLATSWRALLVADLAYKALSFAVLTPATMLLVRWILSRSGSGAMADVEIARFLLTTRLGIVALLAGTTILIAIGVLETACLMAIGLGAARGERIEARSALRFAASRSAPIAALGLNLLVRAIAAILPFLAAIGAIYALLLRGADINYYLSRRPPEFRTALLLAGIVAALFAAFALWLLVRWALTLPMVVFERVWPVRSFHASAARSAGHRSVIAVVLVAWGAIALATGSAVSALVAALMRSLAPLAAGSVAALVSVLAVLLVLWAILSVGVAIFNASLFSLLIVRLWLATGAPAASHMAVASSMEQRRGPLLSARTRIAVAALLLAVAGGLAMVAFQVTRASHPTLVFAHRGASAVAPENTLAAFRLAVAQHADAVELDVQESSDGEVLVVHDSDLMKLGGSPMKIWEHTAAELRSVDIGAYYGAKYRGEHVPTLAEVLAVCKGRAGVVVELKSYGHDQQLEERVAKIVEDAGMAPDCLYMSLDRKMVARMKAVRPQWRVGLLLTKAMGDATSFGADFLAVESHTATARFIRRAHRAGQQVYVWTVNDPARMLVFASRGADGLLTDNPAAAVEVVARRARMSDAQRLLGAVLVRFGARTEALESEDALRP